MFEVQIALAEANQARERQDEGFSRVLRHSALLGEARAEACRVEEHIDACLPTLSRPELRAVAEAAKQEAAAAEEVIAVTEAAMREAREVEARCWQLLAQSKPEAKAAAVAAAAVEEREPPREEGEQHGASKASREELPEEACHVSAELEVIIGDLDVRITQSLFDAIAFGDVWLIQQVHNTHVTQTLTHRATPSRLGVYSLLSPRLASPRLALPCFGTPRSLPNPY